jgi:hypothetical protein
MANNECKGLRILDPVEGLIDYIDNIKPFHTKVIETLVEYTYEETIGITVADRVNIATELLHPYGNEGTQTCSGGFSCVLYGSPYDLPIVSPIQNISVEDFPGVDPITERIIVPGDKTKEFMGGKTFEIVHNIEDISSISRIVDIGSSYFIIEDVGIYGSTFSTDFVITDTVYTSGLHLDDERAFEITNIIPNTPSAGLTRVDVNLVLNSPSVPSGYLGLRKIPGNNNGTYSVLRSEYNQGLNNLHPHTLVTVNEPLNILDTNLGIHQSHQLYIKQTPVLPVPIVKVLSYSNFANPPTNTPDEGIILENIVGVTISTLDVLGFAISGTGAFTVSGDLTKSNIFVDEWIYIEKTLLNNGIYTITDITYNAVDDETTIFVSEKVRDDTIEGTLRLKVPSNSFYVNGDYTHQFHQDVGFSVDSGTFQGKYVTLYADFVNGQTRIRTIDNIFELGSGETITSISSTNEFTVTGDHTSALTVGSNLNIVNSTYNDGMYEVISSVYNVGSDTTDITVVEDILNTTVVDGEMFISVLGEITITKPTIGFSPEANFCGYIQSGWFQHDLVSANATANEFILGGDASTDIFAGGYFIVEGTQNAGLYVAESVNIFGSPPQTRITVEDVYFNDVGGLIKPAFDFIEEYAPCTTLLSASATIKEELSFDWGNSILWPIYAINTGVVEIEGDVSAYLSIGDSINITTSNGNDGTYTLALPPNVTSSGGVLRTLLVLSPGLPIPAPVDQLGLVEFPDAGEYNWFQYVLISANATSNQFTIVGDVTDDIPAGGQFQVVGTDNASNIIGILYTSVGVPIYNPTTNRSTITVANVVSTDTRDGWIEHV